MTCMICELGHGSMDSNELWTMLLYDYHVMNYTWLNLDYFCDFYGCMAWNVCYVCC
jgi:hypothetical protein